MRYTSCNLLLPKIGTKYDKTRFLDFFCKINRFNQDFQKLAVSRKKYIELKDFFKSIGSGAFCAAFNVFVTLYTSQPPF